MGHTPAKRLRMEGMAIVLACLALHTAVASVAVGGNYASITLLTLPPKPGVEYDTYLVDPIYALEQLDGPNGC